MPARAFGMSSEPNSPLTGWRRALLLFFRTVIAVGLVVLAAAVVISVAPQSAPFALAMSGQSRLCAPGEVWQAGDVRNALKEQIEALEAGSRIVETDEDGHELWETPLGRFWAPAGSESSIAVLLAQQEVDQYGAVHGGVEPGDVVLDGGAHIGLYARNAVRQGAELVVAIEPAPANLVCLRRNLVEEIAAGKVVVYPKGIWDQEDELPLYEDPNNSAADSFFEHSTATVVRHSIALTRIDTLVEELGLERVDRIKMDIKGATQKALAGGEQTLREHRPRLVISTEEDSDDPYAIAAQLDALELGYSAGCGGFYVDGGAIEPDIVHFTAAARP